MDNKDYTDFVSIVESKEPVKIQEIKTAFTLPGSANEDRERGLKGHTKGRRGVS